MSDFTAKTTDHEWFKTVNLDSERKVDYLSVIPLYIEAVFIEAQSGRENLLSSGTAYLVSLNDIAYLVTNWHMVTGLNAENGKTILDKDGRIPNQLHIWHHQKGCFSEKVVKKENLFPIDDMECFCNPRWLEHPQKHEVDVVLLKLSDTNGIEMNTLNLTHSDDELNVTPGETISIIGFPEGLHVSNKLPIWKTGHLASDYSVEPNRFRVDATTKSGMSGSPVFAKRVGIYMRSANAASMGATIRFLGTYSGRMTQTADIANVWKPSVLNDIHEASKT